MSKNCADCDISKSRKTAECIQRVKPGKERKPQQGERSQAGVPRLGLRCDPHVERRGNGQDGVGHDSSFDRANRDGPDAAQLREARNGYRGAGDEAAAPQADENLIVGNERRIPAAAGGRRETGKGGTGLARAGGADEEIAQTTKDDGRRVDVAGRGLVIGWGTMAR